MRFLACHEYKRDEGDDDHAYRQVRNSRANVERKETNTSEDDKN
jgi:hypothetical protein